MDIDKPAADFLAGTGGRLSITLLITLGIGIALGALIF